MGLALFAGNAQTQPTVDMDPDLAAAKSRRRRGKRRAGQSDNAEADEADASSAAGESTAFGLPAKFQGFRASHGASADEGTTILVIGIPVEHTQETFVRQLELWGVGGTFDFFMMLPEDDDMDMGFRQAIVNFTDSSFPLLMQRVFMEWHFPATTTLAEVQGLDACLTYSASLCESRSAKPVLFSRPVPSLWAVNVTNELLSPQFREQFHKTKMCAFFMAGRCSRGVACPFAHSAEDLQPAPDLAHTKLCSTYFRGTCNDSHCRYAHGSRELKMPLSNMTYEDGLDFLGLGAGDADGVAFCGMGWYMDSSAWALGDAACYPTQGDAGVEDDEEQSDVDSEEGGQDTDEDLEDLGLFAPPAQELIRRRSFTDFERQAKLSLEEDQAEVTGVSLRRSWSEGDLVEFRDAMEDSKPFS